MTRPSWKYEVNLNTIMQVLTILIMVGGGAAVFAKLQAQVDSNSTQVISLQKQLDDVRAESKTYMTLGYRVDRLENGATVLDSAQKDMEKTINQVASDVRVMREIIEQMNSERQRNPVPK